MVGRSNTLILYKGYTFSKVSTLHNNTTKYYCSSSRRGGCKVVLRINNDDNSVIGMSSKHNHPAPVLRKMETAHFCRKPNGCTQLLYDGYIFNRKQEMRNERWRYSCSKLPSTRCRAVVHLDKENMIIKLIGTFITLTTGQTILMHNDYTYTRRHVLTDKRSYFYCTAAKKEGCKVSLNLNPDNTISCIKNRHTHLPRRMIETQKSPWFPARNS
ncbi:unnamed protein product [Leptosia nina]|uniref:FLYWCH-type domain-containing protein n=1 Tax=Leptosia nina TaxID=320188 RepID=A0AAV1J2Z6_9NEOP